MNGEMSVWTWSGEGGRRGEKGGNPNSHGIWPSLLRNAPFLYAASVLPPLGIFPRYCHFCIFSLDIGNFKDSLESCSFVVKGNVFWRLYGFPDI